MTLQKRFYLNKLFNKHYKKLNDIFFSKRDVLIPFSVANTTDEQCMHISVLTIDTINHKNFPNGIEIAFLNNSKKSKKAIIIFEGKTKISKKCMHLLNKWSCFSLKTVSKLQNNNNTNRFLTFARENPLKKTAQGTKETRLDTSFKMIDIMVGAGIDMHHYKVRLCNSLHPKGRLASVKGQGIKATETVKNQLMLSKAELSNTIVQIIYKVYSSKGNKQAHFTANTLSNIVGAFIVVNSTVYYISDYELKQCALVGSFKQSPITNLRKYNITMQSSLLKKLLSTRIEDTKSIVGIQALNPNTAIFNFLKSSICAGIFHDCKKIVNQLLSILVTNSIAKK